MTRYLAITVVAVAVAAGAQEAPKPDQIYATRCSLCHGPNGGGDGMAAPMLKPPPTNFTSAEYWKTSSADQVKNAITNGKPGTAMTPFGTSLKPEEIAALVDYVKKFAPKP